MDLFDMALGVDASSVDALLHRANLYMLKADPANASKDLEHCIMIRPGHVVARLRLASILAAANDIAGAEAQLLAAAEAEPRSSEVQSYKGKLCRIFDIVDTLYTFSCDMVSHVLWNAIIYRRNLFHEG